MPDNILTDLLAICDGVIDQKKNDWEEMSQKQKIAWIREFAVQNSHPVRYGADN